jgi:hypothetical protein
VAHTNTLYSQTRWQRLQFVRHLVYCVSYYTVPFNSSLLTITLYCSVITTLVYNYTKYSVPFYNFITHFDCIITFKCIWMVFYLHYHYCGFLVASSAYQFSYSECPVQYTNRKTQWGQPNCGKYDNITINPTEAKSTDDLDQVKLA